MKTQSGLGKIVLALLAFALLATAAGCGSSGGGTTPAAQQLPAKNWRARSPFLALLPCTR